MLVQMDADCCLGPSSDSRTDETESKAKIFVTSECILTVIHYHTNCTYDSQCGIAIGLSISQLLLNIYDQYTKCMHNTGFSFMSLEHNFSLCGWT